MSLFSWFKFWILVLYILPVTTGQSQLISSPQPITALVGDDVTLPCRLDPPISASSRAVEWTKPGLDPEYIHVHQDGRLVYQSQNPLYHYRTALFVDQLINGNVSMKLYRVRNSDAGKYRCFIPSLWKEAFIHLSVEEKTGEGKDDFFMVPSSCSTSIVFNVLFVSMFIAAVVLLVWIWRKHKSVHFLLCGETGGGQAENTEPLITKRMEDLGNENKKLKEESKKNQEDITQVIEILREVTKEMLKQKMQTNSQFEEAEKLAEETELKMKKVETEITEKGGDKTANRAQGYLKLKEILQEAGWKQEEIKKEQQQLEMIAENLMKKTLVAFTRLGGIEGDQMKRHEEETENQRERRGEIGARNK